MLKGSGSGQPGSRIDRTWVTPPAQWAESSSIPQIVTWKGTSSLWATAPILHLRSEFAQIEYRAVVAILCSSACRADGACPSVRGPIYFDSETASLELVDTRCTQSGTLPLASRQSSTSFTSTP